MNTQEDFINETNKGSNIFLTGIAGAGKSYILNKWYEDNKDKKKVVKVAPTGIAAINIEGTTIHKAFRLYGDVYHVFKKQEINWNEIDVLIIDEISMVSCEMFDYMSDVIRKYNGSRQMFGGLQVICVGDLAQLPPIYDTRNEETKKRYEKLLADLGGVQFILSEAYKEGAFVMINLTEPQRSKDPKLNQLLNRIRLGDMKAIDEFNTEPTGHFRNKAIHIFHTNYEVDNYNNERLAKIPGKTSLFKGLVKGEFNTNNVLAPLELKLKEGARIMIIKNLECGLVNGDLGEVVKITKDYITIKSDRLEQEFDIETETWKNITYNEHGEEQVHGKFIQYPIKLGWALTAHKSQGTTLDKVVFHYKPYMQRELVYVGLSRATSFEGLYINK